MHLDVCRKFSCMKMKYPKNVFYVKQFSIEILFHILNNMNLREQPLQSNYVYFMKHLEISHV